MPNAGRRRAAVIAACLSAAVLSSMDPTTLSVAGPVIADDLHASVAQTQWIINAFLLALSVLLVASGTLTARIGEARQLRLGMTLFATGALCAVAAPSAGVLIAVRGLEGVGAALMMPGAIGTYRSMFAPERQTVATAVYAGFATGGAALGPLLAGLVLQFASWRVVFAVIAAFGLLVVAVLSQASPPPRAARAGDRLGSGAALANLALGIGLVAIVWALIRTGDHGWSDARVLVALVAGSAVLAGLFTWGAGRSDAARAQGFSIDAIWAAVALLVAVSIGFLGTVVLLSNFLQRVHGYSPFHVGLALLPFSIAAAALMPLAGRLDGRVTAGRQIGVGMVLQIAALLILSMISEDTGYAVILAALIILGAGLSLTVPTLLNGLLRSAAPDRAGLMGAVNLCANQLGALLGVALLGSIAAAGMGPRYDDALARAGATMRSTPALADALGSRGPEAAAAAAPTAERAVALAAGRHAFTDSTTNALRDAALLGVLALGLTAGIGGRLGPRRVVPKTTKGLPALELVPVAPKES